jgi:hypothetical protein
MAQILTFSMLSKNSPSNRGADMATLKIPVTQHDHIRGLARAPVTLVEYDCKKPQKIDGYQGDVTASTQ